MAKNLIFKIILICFINFQQGITTSKPIVVNTTGTTGCQMTDSRKTSGICKKLSDCPFAVGNLQSGILPTPCLTNKSKNPTGDVCCPNNQRRISAERCEFYKNVLRRPVHFDETKSLHKVTYAKEIKVDKKGDLSSIKCETFISPYISGGRDASVREYPHQVALGYGSGNITWRCGGTLISDEFVLTAGHCANSNAKYGQPKKVLLGDRRLSKQDDSNRLIVDVLLILLHPEYKPPIFYNDIALIKLKSKVKLSRSLLPACLPQPEDRLDRKITVETTGWGQMGAAEKQSDVLQSVSLNKFGLKDCSKYFTDDPSLKQRLPLGIIRSQFCAGDKKGTKDTCRGDSGGPVVVNLIEACVFYVIGITSFGSNLCGYSLPGVYTNVQRYLDWIEDNVWAPGYNAGEGYENSKSSGSNSDSIQTTPKPRTDFMFPYIKSSKSFSIPSTSAATTEKQVLLLIGDSRKTGTIDKTTLTTTLRTQNNPSISITINPSILMGPAASTVSESTTDPVDETTTSTTTTIDSLFTVITETNYQDKTTKVGTKPLDINIKSKTIAVPVRTLSKPVSTGWFQSSTHKKKFDSISSQIDSPLSLINETNDILSDIYDSTKISDVLSVLGNI